MPNRVEFTRQLPHYHRIGATFFVTFRLHGTLPKSFLEKLSHWHQKENTRLEALPDAPEKLWSLANLKRDYFQKFDAALDACLEGADHLKRPDIAHIVVQQLQRFDGIWYHLLAYTIMPNHVHVLLDFSVQISDPEKIDLDKYVNLDIVLNRIKGASARYANLALGHTGAHFWQKESHDRYVRNHLHLIAAVDYIKNNVVKAKICHHWQEHHATWVHDRFW